ncbi:hypothetical protein BT69DRAFT_1337442 [Atractiella rhizophila]|nr:hypothetical protein BT69DRAFT_1337442 [Atractiella rhizophila]
MKTIPQTIRSELANGKFPPPAFAIPNPADFFSIPSTPLTQKSIVLMENLLPKWGLNHCYRTFCYALAIAELTGWNKSPYAEELEWDREAIFLACILHDIGWDEKDCIRDDAKLSRLSFEIFGGIKAREGLLKWGATRYVADEVCEAIIRHSDMLDGPGSMRLLQACVMLGATHDIINWGKETVIHPADQEYIIRAYPRHGFTEELHALIHKEWTHKPGCLFEKQTEPFVSYFTANLEAAKETDGPRQNEQEKQQYLKRRMRVDLDNMTLDGSPF